ncbi:hypothetical protein D1872_233770 [compost metagenome]
MTLHEQIKAFTKSNHIKTTVQLKGGLFKISCRIFIHQTEEEHALLHRRQSIHIFQLTHILRILHQLLQLIQCYMV